MNLIDQFAEAVLEQYNENPVGAEKVKLSCRFHQVSWEGTHEDFVRGRRYSHWAKLHNSSLCGPERRKEKEDK